MSERLPKHIEATFPGYVWATLRRVVDGLEQEMKLTIGRESGEKVLITREQWDELVKGGWRGLQFVPHECTPWETDDEPRASVPGDISEDVPF